MPTKAQIKLKESIDRARDKEGRNQTWIIARMNEYGNELTDTRFSRKKKGHEFFTEQELSDLSCILKTNLSY